ncbi:MAG: NYN domain-containing protein [Anaerolineae bacterium]|nr:NYN domain-containing protein [Anaerolineae bacterium]
MYLIDGHNLIAQMPDIDLADPDDEMKLVLKLRSFAARSAKNIRMTVVFDTGIPGGIEKSLSNSRVTARFAAAEHSSADNVLRSLIEKAANPAAYTLVSSDQELAEIARQKKMSVLSAQEFITQMHAPAQKQQRLSEEKKDNPSLSKAEVDEWLKIFSED